MFGEIAILHMQRQIHSKTHKAYNPLISPHMHNLCHYQDLPAKWYHSQLESLHKHSIYAESSPGVLHSKDMNRFTVIHTHIILP